MNICHFSGRLGSDAELRYTKDGTAKTTFNLAVDSGSGDYKRTDWIRCVLWKREKLAQYLTKGKPVVVTGEYQEQKWEDKDGQERRMVEIVVRELEFQQGQPKQGETQNQAHRQQPKPDDDTGPAFPSEANGMDDVPFS